MTLLLLFCYMLGHAVNMQSNDLIDMIQLDLALQQIKPILKLPEGFNAKQALEDIDTWIALFDKKLREKVSQDAWKNDKDLPAWITDEANNSPYNIQNPNPFFRLYAVKNVFPEAPDFSLYKPDAQFIIFLNQADLKLKRLFEQVSEIRKKGFGSSYSLAKKEEELNDLIAEAKKENPNFSNFPFWLTNPERPIKSLERLEKEYARHAFQLHEYQAFENIESYRKEEQQFLITIKSLLEQLWKTPLFKRWHKTQ